MPTDDVPPEFDPYYKWLGVPREEQPCNLYRLLGINLFESDADVIASAADRQMAFLRSLQSGPHPEHAAKLLNEVTSARRLLLSPERRADYDRGLHRTAAAVSAATSIAPPLAQPTARSGPDAVPLLQQPTRPRPRSRDARARKRPDRLSLVAGVMFLVVVGIGVVGIAYTVLLNRDMIVDARPIDSQPAFGANVSGELNGISPPFPDPAPTRVNSPLSNGRPDESTEATPAPTIVAVAEDLQNEPSDRSSGPVFPTPEALVPIDASPSLPNFAGLTGKGGAGPNQAVFLELPSALNEVRPRSLLALGDARPQNVSLSIYPCQLRRDTEALTLRTHDQHGRWSVIEAESPNRQIAHFGVADGELQFLWAQGVTPDLATLLRYSFLTVQHNGRTLVARLSELGPRVTVVVDLEHAETEQILSLPVLYPPEDLRMEVLGIDGSGEWDTTALVGQSVADGQSVQAHRSGHGGVSAGMSFDVRGKRLLARVKVRYQAPDGREYGLLARHVQQSLAEMQVRLVQTKQAESALPKLREQATSIRRLMNDNIHAAHLQPQLNITERDIRAARSLIDSKKAAEQRLQFVQRLVPIGEEIHNNLAVTCAFYLLHDGWKIPLTSP